LRTSWDHDDNIERLTIDWPSLKVRGERSQYHHHPLISGAPSTGAEQDDWYRFHGMEIASPRRSGGKSGAKHARRENIMAHEIQQSCGKRHGAT